MDEIERKILKEVERVLKEFHDEEIKRKILKEVERVLKEFHDEEINPLRDRVDQLDYRIENLKKTVMKASMAMDDLIKTIGKAL